LNRSKDRLNQAESFLLDAKELHKKGSYYLVCFLSQQTAEFSLKALCEYLNIICWGHELLNILTILENKGNIQFPNKIKTACYVLNKYYISTRYPNAFSSGTPANLFSEFESEQAINFAEEVFKFVKSKIY